MKRTPVIVLVVWIVCGPFTYAITLGYFQGGPRSSSEWCRKDAGVGVMFGLAGPFGLAVSFAGSGFVKHGLKWSCQ